MGGEGLQTDGSLRSGYALAAPRVVGAAEPAWVGVRDGRVAAVGAGRPPAGMPVVSLPWGMLAPGFVDLQVNGWGGVDFATSPPEAWVETARRLPATGVTAFLPTLITAPVQRLAEGLADARRAATEVTATGGAARIVGVHVEGPFLSPRYRGAHDPRWLAEPDPAAVDALLRAAGDLPLLVTLAPELPGAIEAIRRLVAAGARVSIGHSDATEAQCRGAFDAGATMVTHLFNAQRGLHHREPGVAGAGMTDPRVVCGLIVDGHHVAPSACRIALAAAPGRIALVSDATAAAGMAPGRYELAGRCIEVVDGAPPVLADGTLAGSALNLDRAVANAAGLGLALPDAIRAATAVPAGAIGRPDLGRLAPGALADLLWLDDELRPVATWVRGELVHSDTALDLRPASARRRS